MADIVLINARFDPSFWGMEYALPLVGKRCAMPVAALPLLSALTPPEHRVTIIDENVEPICYERLAGAHIVGVTGMSVQRYRMLEILTELKRRGHFTVVGGPWITVKEDYFNGLADVIFVGEAEETWPLFLQEWSEGRHARRYEQAERTDMTRVPVPRYDLLKMRHYLFGSVQFSRGCPFQCEFCDISVTFGRRPRFKSIPQILAELDMLRDQKMEIVFIVDDNFIGNRKYIKTILPAIAGWQEHHGFPFIFCAEASLDLAEDEELMHQMIEANILSVFLGVETPNEESLRETGKFQNLSQSATVLERVHRVQGAGLEVWCGMIVGFDHDDRSIFERQRDFLDKSRITEVMIGMLFAIPKTPLHKRLAAIGRLDPDDRPAFGTNVIPLEISREELRDGYVALMQEIYEPARYFARLDALTGTEEFQFAPSHARYLRHHFWARLATDGKYVMLAAVLYLQLMRYVKDPSLWREYRRRIATAFRRRPEPAFLWSYLLKCLMHYHHHTMARLMQQEAGKLVNAYQ